MRALPLLRARAMREAGSLCLALLLPVVAGLEFSYHHSEQLETFLKEVHQQHPSITALHSIGRSVAGVSGSGVKPVLPDQAVVGTLA
ncbi:receptor activity-modifying protein 2 [Platysternon megacephalum]|uniref:Receptor activity-modifying protein 2 n=1 Tax=Platysternon megacephalum TaxID=55544 RepID=A0A4D9F049_9SAUR|nr:receptor activity-modifying protein 2 [Platysternon megacephalum]